MSTIGPYNGIYVPPAPPPPPPPTNPDGTPREPEVIVVIAPAQPGDPHRPLLPYDGLSGAQSNHERDMAFSMAGPEERALMLGMNPYAEDGFLRDEDGLYNLQLAETIYDNDGWGLTQVGIKPSIGLELALEFFLSPNPVNYNDPGIWRENALSAAYPKLPTDWGVRLSNPGTIGLMWADPNNTGTSVRVMKGIPDAIYPSQRVDYVKVQINGASVLSDGTRLQGGGNEASAHIPLKQWLTWPSWSSPR